MLKIAILIFSKSDQLCNDKQYLSPLFAQEDLIYEEVIWDGPDINWKQYDAVVIRSTCDYFEDKYEQFLAVLKDIENQGIPLLNSFDVVQWNSKKDYLADLHSKGINVIETIITTPEQTKDLALLLQENNWPECVIKPAISGGAYKTFRLTQEQAHEFDISTYFEPKELFLIQPFAKEIIDEGEWSFIFFDKKFSHCMLSRPKPGDFRVQFFSWWYTFQGSA